MPASKDIAQKAVDAALAAIEIYNKPDFKHREETFSILMTNAWELLLKARHLFQSGEREESLYEMVKDANGQLVPKTNRSNNPITHGLGYLLEKLAQDQTSGITKSCYQNILLLIEVRDTSVHFVNKDLFFSKRIQEIGTASLRSFVTLCQEWFALDLSRYNFYLMPLSFYHGFETVESISVTNYSEQMRRLLAYLAQVENEYPSDATNAHNVTLHLETKFVRSNTADAIAVRFSSDPNVPAMNVREEDVLKNYPYDYEKLTKALKDRYSDFLANEKYHKIRKPLISEKKYCIVRLLDPSKPCSGSKTFFSSEVFKVFDKHYTKK
jgi:Domain of unknown function (DUF3644)